MVFIFIFLVLRKIILMNKCECILIAYWLHTCFGEVSVQIFCPFLNQVVCLPIIVLRQFFIYSHIILSIDGGGAYLCHLRSKDLCIYRSQKTKAETQVRGNRLKSLCGKVIQGADIKNQVKNQGPRMQK